MKKHSLLFLFLLTTNGIVFGIDPGKKDPPTQQSIPQSTPVEMSPIFAVDYYNDFINITGLGYTGTVLVYIIGENGFTTTITMDGTLNEFIDLSNLASGTYILEIVTNAGIVHESEFEL